MEGGLEVVLIARASSGREGAEQSTADLTLQVALGDTAATRGPVTPVPATEWPGSSGASQTGRYVAVDHTSKTHFLPGFSPFGTGRTNEFATWTMGRETFLSSPELREKCEDDIRSFAERSDHTEGFMLNTPISDGFGGFTSVFLEMIRDEFTKSTIFTTATLSDSLGWKRTETERSVNQRLMNAALSIQHLEELSSMLLPIQPPASWEPETPWARFLRNDLPKPASYSQILTAHLQSANSELREVDGLTSIVNQLNWRGDNKIAHLQGAAPFLSPDQLEGPNGVQIYKDSVKDFSILPNLPPPKTSTRAPDPNAGKPFAQYTVVRGYEDEEVARLGPILESSTPLREPLSVWVCLPHPYPILPPAAPIFRSLLPNGRPIVLELPTSPDPLSPSGLFGLPPPLFGTLSSSYFVQPTSIPLLTTLSTSPAARFLLRHLSAGVKELQRTRYAGLFEYEEGEYGIGREGVMECRERLETLADNHGAAGGVASDSEEEAGEDEDWEME